VFADLVCIAYYIAFGAHGPRAQDPPGEGWRVAMYTGIGIAASFVLFVTIRSFGGGAPRTMNREWEEATNEYLKVRYHPPLSP
jgi:cytochrome c oxidase subunit 4